MLLHAVAVILGVVACGFYMTSSKFETLPPLSTPVLSHKERQRVYACAIKFHRLCTSLGVKYWIHSKTLLGAVRHRDVVPCDMTFYVAVPKSDFSKLLGSYVSRPDEIEMELGGSTVIVSSHDFQEDKWVSSRGNQIRFGKHEPLSRLPFGPILLSSPPFHSIDEYLVQMYGRSWCAPNVTGYELPV